MMSPLSKKLQIKPGHNLLVLDAPEDVTLEPLPEGARVATKASKGKTSDVVLLFVKDSKELAKGAPKAIAALSESSIFWVAYPKKSSKIETDLSRDAGWQPIFEAGLGPVTQVAIDATWSALRFKPEEQVARKPGSVVAPDARMGMRKGAAAKKKVEINAPEDLASEMAKSPSARATWDSMAPSHRKEYVGWIEEAKKADTRARRVEKAIEMMAAGVKNRNEKYAG